MKSKLKSSTGKLCRSVILTILFFLPFIADTSGADLLDKVKSNSKLVNDLRDTYRAYKINNKITDQKELVNRLINYSSQNEPENLLENNII